MRRLRWFAGSCVVVLLVLAATLVMRDTEAVEAAGQGQLGAVMKPGRVCLRIQLGLKDEENTPWDGSISLSAGSVVGLEIWRKGERDEVEGNTWKLSSRPAPRFMPQKDKPQPPSENGIVVTLDGVDETSTISVTTEQGDFSWTLADVPFGARLFRLKGRADVIRVPASYQLAADAELVWVSPMWITYR